MQPHGASLAALITFKCSYYQRFQRTPLREQSTATPGAPSEHIANFTVKGKADGHPDLVPPVQK
jgi:hypothetical protein